MNTWTVKKIGVVGPGIVGMPMAALLAHAKIRIGSEEPARVVVIQRNSRTSGWKVDAINAGKSVIGGIEPDLDRIVAESVAHGRLSASHEYEALCDADVILICVQTDKKGFGPDYGPMMEALNGIATALQKKPADKHPIIVFESTLAPSSMDTIIRDHFASYGLKEGEDIHLANSPNRVMPGRLVERVAASDKIIGALHPDTAKKVKDVYRHIVTAGTLHLTNSFTAEIVKTLENAYRDVRIAFSTEIVRYCDKHDIDFYDVRERVNAALGQLDGASHNPTAVPCGGLLVPTVGVGGHCLPKDGILLLWRKIESGADMSRSLILASRSINDASPAYTMRMSEKLIGPLSGKKVGLMGVAYRFNSEDTRNSPTLELAKLLKAASCRVMLHDPFVKSDDQNILRYGMADDFTHNAESTIDGAEAVIFCTGHDAYREMAPRLTSFKQLRAVVDGCNLFNKNQFEGSSIAYAGIGRGNRAADAELIEFVTRCFRTVERGVANEVDSYVRFANERYVVSISNRVRFEEIRRIAGTCVTGCAIADTGPVERVAALRGFLPRLVTCAMEARE